MGDQEDRERQEKLRQNTSFDPSLKENTVEDLDPMNADNWAGGGINPEAKKIARGEAPADRERGADMPPTDSPPMTQEESRPWAPHPEAEPSGKS